MKVSIQEELIEKATTNIDLTMRGCCIVTAIAITEAFLEHGFKDFTIVEGWIEPGGVGEYDHTWIVLNDGTIVDPSYVQFEVPAEEMTYLDEVHEINKPHEYLQYFKVNPLPTNYIEKYQKKNSS